MSWQSEPLSALTLKIGSGSTPRGGDSVYISEGTTLIRSQNVYNNEFSTDGLVYIDEKTAEKMKGVSVEKEDVLVNITGDSVARCCLVHDAVLPARVNQHVAILRTNPKKLLPHFLAFYMVSPFMQAKMLSWAGTGGTRKALTKGMLEGFEIPLPPVDVQDKIVQKIRTYNDLIENNRRRIQLLEESARLLYQEWFVHLRFSGHEQVKIIDGVPEGWEKKPLSELCVDIRETVRPDSFKPETPYIGLEHIPRRSITLSDWDSAEKVTSNKFRFQKSDIIFGKIRPYFHKVGFAICDGITSSDAIVIRALDEFYYQYLLMYLSSDYFVALASKTCKEGSKMPRADWKYLQSTDVLVPSDFLLEQFSEQVNMVIGQLEVLARYNKSLVQARDLLLPKLMSGELAV